MDYQNLEEKRLIKEIQKGKTQAFDELMSRHSEYLFAWIMSKSKNETQSEEIFQITITKCWKRIHNFRGDSKFKTWACAIARNVFIDDWRKSQRLREESLEALTDSGGERFFRESEEPDFLKSFKDEELGVFLDMVMNKLSPQQASVLRRFALEELSYEEISKAERCSVGTVMSRLFYARKRAQKIVKSYKNDKLYCGNND